MSKPFDEPLSEKGKYYATVVNAFKKLLLDERDTDLTIIIGKEQIPAHASVVSCRCEEIIGFPDEKSRKKKKQEVKLKEGIVSAAIMSKILEYLYTGIVEFSKVSDKDILLLSKASRHFKLRRLEYLCERWLTQNLTVESVFHVLKAATDLNEERAKGFCVQFALQHYNDFISNKDGIYILGIELFQEVVAAFQQNPPAPKEISAAEVPDTLLSDFKKLFDSMPYSDVNLLIGNDTVKCHHAILAAYSDSLANAIAKDPDNEIKVSSRAFLCLLKFCYYGCDDIPPLSACELISMSRKFNLLELEAICVDKIRDSVSAETVLKILSVSYLPSQGKQDLNEELRAKCIPFILANLDTIDLSAIRGFNPLMIVDLLLEVQNACKKGDYGLSASLSGQKVSRTTSDSADSKSSRKERKAPPPPPRSKSTVTEDQLTPQVRDSAKDNAKNVKSVRRKSKSSSGIDVDQKKSKKEKKEKKPK